MIRSVDFSSKRKLLYQVLSYYDILFQVVDMDGSIILDSAIDYLVVLDILEDLGFNMHLSSIELPDARPGFEHFHPELCVHDDSITEPDSSHENIDSDDYRRSDDDWVISDSLDEMSLDLED